MNPAIDNYLLDGCMRCNLGGTPECKVRGWQEELQILRGIILACELKEELKWSCPCYTHEGKNVLMMSALKDSATISFFKGSLLKDPEKILIKPGSNSQAARYLKFTSVNDIVASEKTIKTYVREAIALETVGAKVVFKKDPEPIPEELQTKLNDDPILRSAFEALTPGRQRGYILHFSQPKQPKTRTSRIENCIPKILQGKGYHDR